MQAIIKVHDMKKKLVKLISLFKQKNYAISININ